MTISRTDLAARPGPRYRALADGFERAIRERRLKPGDRLPPQRDIAYDLGVTVGTVGRAYGLLLQRGLVRGEVGRGTFVLSPKESAAGGLPEHAPLAGREHDLAVNRPVRVPAHADVFRILGDIARDEAVLGELLTYPPYGGIDSHRLALARWLESFADKVEPDRVLPTQGTQNGVAAAMAAVTRPGDTILMEAFAYPSNQGLAGRFGLRVEPIAMDDEGILPDAIDVYCRRHRAKAIVLSPDMHNPTLATASCQRREAIVAAARRHDLVIIEDAVYAPVAASGLPPLLSLAPERTFFVTSISKFLAPGLRFGCVVAPLARFAQLAAAQAHLAIGVSPLIAEAFMRLHREGLLADALVQQWAALASRRQAALAALAGMTVASRENALHVLLELPAGLELATTTLRLGAAGIRTTPLSAFALGRAPQPPALRLSLGGETDEASLTRCLLQLRDLLATGAIAQPVI